MQPKKPISEKQLAANRANAKKSTGPRTKAGKSAVGLNAVRHGLRGRIAVLPSEDCAAHHAFCGAFIGEYAPANATELSLVLSIANDFWRLDRARAIEINMLAVGHLEADHNPDHDANMQAALASARTFMNHTHKFVLLSLYEQRIHRSLHRNLTELPRMQAERRQARQMQLERILKEARPDEKEARPDEHPAAPNGFVCANEVSAASRAAKAA